MPKGSLLDKPFFTDYGPKEPSCNPASIMKTLCWNANKLEAILEASYFC